MIIVLKNKTHEKVFFLMWKLYWPYVQFLLFVVELVLPSCGGKKQTKHCVRLPFHHSNVSVGEEHGLMKASTDTRTQNPSAHAVFSHPRPLLIYAIQQPAKGQSQYVKHSFCPFIKSNLTNTWSLTFILYTVSIKKKKKTFTTQSHSFMPV